MDYLGAYPNILRSYGFWKENCKMFQIVLEYAPFGSLNEILYNFDDFPGWKCRFYVADDVLNLTISVLKDLGADIEYIPPGMGKMSGMFWRFMVADDPTVDRYIIRDVDSRLNSRDR
jgi:hypothetical protein